MKRRTIKKVSVAMGLFSFTLVFFGSWIYGARIESAFIRGVEGFAIFGLLAWSVLRGWAAIAEAEKLGEVNDKDKGINLDQTA